MRSFGAYNPLGKSVFVSLLAGLSVFLSACNNAGGRSAQASAGPPAIPVAVATAQQRDFPVYLSGLGNVQAYNTVSLKSRVDGQIVQIAFKEGQLVKQGDLLIVIDPRPYQVAVEQATHELATEGLSTEALPTEALPTEGPPGAPGGPGGGDPSRGGGGGTSGSGAR